MIEPKQFKVYDVITGEFITEGTAKECAEALRMSVCGFRDAAKSSTTKGHSKFLIEENDPGPKKGSEPHSGLVRAAKKWDEFCEPIRREFGIPVYKAPKEDGKK